MVETKAGTTTEVTVTYAGGRGGPWKQTYLNDTQLGPVREDAMSHFQVADSTDAGGNQILFRLYHGRDRMDDLNQTVGDRAEGRPHLSFRLVREVIAG
jgi:hypothetical protein